jgi:hypothetical protein
MSPVHVSALERAARDGHTVLPAATLLSVMAGAAGAAGASGSAGPTGDGSDGSHGSDLIRAALRAAVDAGEVTLVDAPGHPLALPSLAAAEHAVAEAVVALAATGAVTLVDAGRGCGRTTRLSELAGKASGEVVATSPVPSAAAGLGADLGVDGVPLAAFVERSPSPDAALVVVDAAEALSVPAAAALVGALPDGCGLVLAGDSALPAARPGRVFGDLLEAGPAVGVAVERLSTPVRTSGTGSVLARLAAAVRAGELPPVDDPGREVVVVPCADSQQAVHRAGQLVRDSIPRAVGIPPDQVAVLTPMRRGPAGAAALAAADLPAHVVTAVPGRRWPAVVAVLPPEACGLLSRPLIAAMVSAADRHLSVVHAAGPVLARAVRSVPARPRRTALATLLRQAAGEA